MTDEEQFNGPRIIREDNAAIMMDDDESGRTSHRPSFTLPTVPVWKLPTEERQAALRAQAERLKRIRNLGAYDDILGKPTIDGEDIRNLVDGAPDSRANEVTERTLQREIRVRGGGGSKSGRRRSRVLKKSVHEPPGRDLHGDRLVHTVVFRGVTRGQEAVFRDHPDVRNAVEEMLVAVSRYVRDGGAPPSLEDRPKQIIPGHRNIALVISDRETARHLRMRYMRGVALAVLITQVMRFDPHRVQMLDADAYRRKGLDGSGAQPVAAAS